MEGAGVAAISLGISTGIAVSASPGSDWASMLISAVDSGMLSKVTLDEDAVRRCPGVRSSAGKRFAVLGNELGSATLSDTFRFLREGVSISGPSSSSSSFTSAVNATLRLCVGVLVGEASTDVALSADLEGERGRD